MAAVTVTARSYKAHNLGSATAKMWNIGGGNGDTLDTGIKSRYTVAFFMEPTSLITAITQSVVNGQIRITFTAGGAFAGMDLLGVYRNG